MDSENKLSKKGLWNIELGRRIDEWRNKDYKQQMDNVRATYDFLINWYEEINDKSKELKKAFRSKRMESVSQLLIDINQLMLSLEDQDAVKQLRQDYEGAIREFERAALSTHDLKVMSILGYGKINKYAGWFDDWSRNRIYNKLVRKRDKERHSAVKGMIIKIDKILRNLKQYLNEAKQHKTKGEVGDFLDTLDKIKLRQTDFSRDIKTIFDKFLQEYRPEYYFEKIENLRDYHAFFPNAKGDTPEHPAKMKNIDSYADANNLGFLPFKEFKIGGKTIGYVWVRTNNTPMGYPEYIVTPIQDNFNQQTSPLPATSPVTQSLPTSAPTAQPTPAQPTPVGLATQPLPTSPAPIDPATQPLPTTSPLPTDITTDMPLSDYEIPSKLTSNETPSEQDFSGDIQISEEKNLEEELTHVIPIVDQTEAIKDNGPISERITTLPLDPQVTVSKPKPKPRQRKMPKTELLPKATFINNLSKLAKNKNYIGMIECIAKYSEELENQGDLETSLALLSIIE